MSHEALTLERDTARQERIYSNLRKTSVVLAVAVILVGVLVMFGWQFNVESFRRLIPHTVAMNPLSALCFILSGVSLVLMRKEGITPRRMQYARALAILVAAIGLLKLTTYLFDWDLFLDSFLFREKLQEVSIKMPNRMAPNTAFNFLLSGLALYFLPSNTRLTQIICSFVLLITLLILSGYIYGAHFLYEVGSFIPMAVHSAIAFQLLSLGIMFARPSIGIVYILIGDNTGTGFALSIAALLLPLLIGWVILRGEKTGRYDSELSTALQALAGNAMALYFTWHVSLLQYRRRREVEAAHRIIREQAQQLQSLMDCSSAPISVKDLNGHFVRVNKQFENLFHVTAEQIKGKTAADIFPPETAAAISLNDAEVISKAAAVDMEEIYPEDDGLHTFLTVTFPLFTTKGRMYGISRISTDITERKRLEEELHESEQRLKAILASIGEGVVVADTEGRFLLYNPVAEMLTGLGATEGPAADWSQKYGIFSPEDQTTLMPVEEMPLYKAIKGEKSNNAEMFIRNANVPEGRYINVTGTPISDADGTLIGGVVVMRDVTEQRQLEKLLMENDKQLRTVISSIGEGIVVTDPKGRYLLLNPKAEELLGISALDASSTHWPLKEFLFEADGETPILPAQQPLARALKGETVTDMKVAVKHPKLQQTRFLSVNAHPLRNEHRAISAAIADFKDVTEVRRLEDTVQQIEKRYRSLLKMNPSTDEALPRQEEL